MPEGAMMIYTGGKLKIKLCEAKILKDDRIFFKMDPFCVLEVSGHQKKYRTKVANGQGKNPHWNDVFEITVPDINHEIKYAVMDDKLLGNATLGFGII